MSAKNSSTTTVILILLVHLFSFGQKAHCIENKSQWDVAFQSQYGTSDPMLNITNANEKGMFSWRAHYWVRAYVSMAQTYGDTKYLDKAVTLIDFMLDNRDEIRYARGELDLRSEPYVSAPLYYLNHRNEAAPGWRILAFGNEWRIQTLDDGQITHAIMRFVDLVHNKEQFSKYQEKAQKYLGIVEKIVNTHNSLFAFNRFDDIPGSYYYPNVNGKGLYRGAVPFNHSATMGVTLLLLDRVKGGVPEYRQKAEAIVGYFKKHVRVTPNNAYDWDYNPQKQRGDEDFNHAHIDLSLLILAHHQGLKLSTEDMHRFANTLTKNVYLGNGKLAWSVDGTQTKRKKNYWPVGFDWIDLAQFDPKVLDIAQEVYKKHYSSPTWSRPFLGWAEILRWTSILRGNTQRQ